MNGVQVNPGALQRVLWTGRYVHESEGVADGQHHVTGARVVARPCLGWPSRGAQWTCRQDTQMDPQMNIQVG